MLGDDGQQATFRAALRAAAASMGIELSESCVLAMWRHFCAMTQQNEFMNLTRITDPVEAAVKHYADSLALAAWTVKENVTVRSLLDVGTGAGFPAVPLAIVRTNWRITGMDGTRKKVDFVRRTAAELGLSNLRTQHAHTRHWQTQEKFDVVALRAVCKLPEGIETCARFVERRGWLVIYKTAQLDAEERKAGTVAARGVGLEESVFQYQIDSGAENLRRALHVYRAS